MTLRDRLLTQRHFSQRIVGAALAASTLSLLAPAAAAQSTDLGTFESSTSGWGVWASARDGATAALSTRNGHAVIQASGSAAWQAQFVKPLTVSEQTTYRVGFDGWASSPRDIQVRLRNDNVPVAKSWISYANEDLRLSTTRTRHEVLLTIPNLFVDGAVDGAQMMFHLGDGATTEVYLDNITIEAVGEGDHAPSGALNLVAPGNFDQDGQQGFFLYADTETTRGDFSVQKGELQARFPDGGDRDWHVQMLRNARLKADTDYELEFYAIADRPRSVAVELLDADEYLSYDLVDIDVPAGESLQRVTLSTNAVNPGAGRLAFRLGGSDVGVAVDDVRLTDPSELFANGGFDYGTDGWTAYSSTGSAGLSTGNDAGGAGFSGDSLKVAIGGGTGNWWDGGVFTDLNLASNAGYVLDLALQGSGNRAVQVQVRDDSNIFLNQRVDVSGSAATHSMEFGTGTMSGDAQLFVFFGDSATDFRVDGVSVKRSGIAPPTMPEPTPAPGPDPQPEGNPGELVSPSAFDARDYAHLESLISDQSRMDADVRAAYSDWAGKFLKRPAQSYIDANGGQEMLFVTGFDQSFVGRPENGAVSEGVGYGLVITALMDDRQSFDRIWRFAESKLNRHGLMEWLYDNNGYTVDFNGGSGRVNATDGDLDAAYGLLVAAARWQDSSYSADAKTLIDNILEHNVTDENYLTSGDDGYDENAKRATLNRPLVTSYMAPGYFRMFADFTGDARWDTVATQGMQQLRNNQADVRAQGAGAGQDGDGLITFRMFESGKIDFSDGGSIYHSDGARAPWRVATDLAWYGTGQARDFVDDFNGFARRQGIDNVYESYNEKGQRVGGWGGTQAGWMSGPLASSMLVSGSTSERDQTWGILMNSYGDGYYSGSCRMLGILTAAGWYTNPVVPD